MANFDMLHYFEAAPLPQASVGARLACVIQPMTCSPPVLVINNLSISSGTYTTAIFVLALQSPGQVHTAALLCIDSVVLPSGGLAACQVFFPS